MLALFTLSLFGTLVVFLYLKLHVERGVPLLKAQIDRYLRNTVG